MTANFRINWTDSLGVQHDIDLHKPYPNSANGNLSFNNSNFSFRSGHYDSLIDEINDESISLNGYENISAMTKFVELGVAADEGYEIYIFNLKSEYCGIYIIKSILYNPIGLDVFDYSISLRFVRENTILSGTLCLPVCWNSSGKLYWN